MCLALSTGVIKLKSRGILLLKVKYALMFFGLLVDALDAYVPEMILK